MSENVEHKSIEEKPYDSEDAIFLFLAYFGIFSLIPFFVFREKRNEPKKEFVYFHARQGLAIALTGFCCGILFMFVGFILWLIPFIGWALNCMLWLSLVVIFLGSAIIGWIKAFNGERYEIPVFSSIAKMFG